MALRPPIIVAEGLDVLIFENIQAAKNYLEPIDVDDGVYVAFDSAGQVLVISTDGNKISIELSGEARPESLHTLLTAFLVAKGIAREHLRSLTLSDLVYKAQEAART